MKKILIVSDTHRKDENLKQVIEKEKPLDMLIHLGDAEGSEYAIASWVNETCQMQMISGNNDFFSSLDRERDVEIGRYRVLLTHGHFDHIMGLTVSWKSFRFRSMPARRKKKFWRAHS